MKPVKIIVIALIVYVGIVVAFESMLGIIQPDAGVTLIITTTGSDGSSNDRVLTRLESNGQIYVAANHWPRAWYNDALGNPNVLATIEGNQAAYMAVSVSAEEHTRLQSENGHGLIFRILTGFPPRYFLRLDPRESSAS